MVNPQLFYLFFIIFWIYVIYNVCISKSNKEGFITFPLQSFDRMQQDVAETDYGKKTNIKEELSPSKFLEIMKPKLVNELMNKKISLDNKQKVKTSKSSLFKKYNIKNDLIKNIGLNPEYNLNKISEPSASYNNKYVFSQIKQYNKNIETDNISNNLEFIYQPKPYEMVLTQKDPREAMKTIGKEQNHVVETNENLQKNYNRGLQIAPQISKEIVTILNKHTTLTKPFKRAILEPYKIDNMKPVFMVKEKNTEKEAIGVLYEGLLYRYNKYFVYQFTLDVTLLNDYTEYIVHDIDIVAFKSSDEVSTSFGKYTKNKKDSHVCFINDETGCNPQNVISFKEMEKNQEDQRQTLLTELSKKCVGKFTFNRSECISEDPATNKVGIWM